MLLIVITVLSSIIQYCIFIYLFSIPTESGILRPSILTVRVQRVTCILFIILLNINQMSASTSKAGESSKPAEQKAQENLPSLGVLEEDDEFEEFAVAGQAMISSLI